MAGNKRVATKHIRDGIKANYPKLHYCEICGDLNDLEFHHYTTVSLLLKSYAQENSIPISTDEEVLAMREVFYQKHWHDLVDNGVTLCSSHHASLHKTYGKAPPLHTAKKQERWVGRQRDTIGLVTDEYIQAVESGSGIKHKTKRKELPDDLAVVSSPKCTDLVSFMTSRIPLQDFKV